MSFESARFKQLERAGYNRIGARYLAAAGQRRVLVDALLDFAAPRDGERILDLAAGPGLLAAAARERAPGALIVASDIAEAQLASGPALPRVAADAERLPFADCSVDLVLCGLGLMFFPDEDTALAEMRRVLRPGGRLALSVWGPAAEVPLVACALDCLRRVLPPPKVSRPPVFRCGEPGWLESHLAGADFSDATLDSCFASPADYWQAFLDLAGGTAESLSRLPESMQIRLREEVTEELAPYAVTGADAGGYRMRSRVRLARLTASL